MNSQFAVGTFTRPGDGVTLYRALTEDSSGGGDAAKVRRLSSWPAGVGWLLGVPLTLRSLFCESVSEKDYCQFITHAAIMILAPVLFMCKEKMRMIPVYSCNHK